MSIKIVVLASGRGSNFEAIHAACQEGRIDGEIVGLFSDKEEAVALKTAEKYGLTHKAVIAKNYTDKIMYEKALVYYRVFLDYMQRDRLQNMGSNIQVVQYILWIADWIVVLLSFNVLLV